MAWPQQDNCAVGHAIGVRYTLWLLRRIGVAQRLKSTSLIVWRICMWLAFGGCDGAHGTLCMLLILARHVFSLPRSYSSKLGSNHAFASWVWLCWSMLFGETSATSLDIGMHTWGSKPWLHARFRVSPHVCLKCAPARIGRFLSNLHGNFRFLSLRGMRALPLV